jgi:sugar phosphate isomerase/epimerase
VKFAICNEIFQNWKIDDVFRYAAKLGYDAVEIAPFTLANSVTDISPQERTQIRELAARNAIAIAGIHWVLVKPEGLYLNHSDGAIRDRTARYFRDLTDFCAYIGGTVKVVGSPKQRNIMTGVDPGRPGTGRWTRFGRRFGKLRSAASPSALNPCRQRKRTSSIRLRKRFVSHVN